MTRSTSPDLAIRIQLTNTRLQTSEIFQDIHLKEKQLQLSCLGSHKSRVSEKMIYIYIYMYIYIYIYIYIKRTDLW